MAERPPTFGGYNRPDPRNSDTSPSREEELEAKNQALLDNLNNAAETIKAFVITMVEQQEENARLKAQVEEAKGVIQELTKLAAEYGRWSCVQLGNHFLARFEKEEEKTNA